MPLRWRLARFISLPLLHLDRPRPRSAMVWLTAKVWGNPGYSANMELLAEVDRHAAQARHVVDLGAGLSTLILRRRRSDGSVTSLEHDREWVDALRRILPERPGDELVFAPLSEISRGVEWYSADLDRLASTDLIICDGPPGSTPGGRWGLMELVRRLRGPATVIVDDTDRDDERALVDALLTMPRASLLALPQSSPRRVSVVYLRSGP